MAPAWSHCPDAPLYSSPPLPPFPPPLQTLPLSWPPPPRSSLFSAAGSTLPTFVSSDPTDVTPRWHAQYHRQDRICTTSSLPQRCPPVPWVLFVLQGHLLIYSVNSAIAFKQSCHFLHCGCHGQPINAHLVFSLFEKTSGAPKGAPLIHYFYRPISAMVWASSLRSSKPGTQGHARDDPLPPSQKSQIHQGLNNVFPMNWPGLSGNRYDNEPILRIILHSLSLSCRQRQVHWGHTGPIPLHTSGLDKILFQNQGPLWPLWPSSRNFFFLYIYYKAPQINEQSTGVRCRPPHLDALGGIPKMPKLSVSLFVPGASILALFHLHQDTGPWKQTILNNFDKNKSQSSGLVPTFTEWTVITGKIWAPTHPGHPPIHEKKTLRELIQYINIIFNVS